LIVGRAFTIGHGARPLDELVACLLDAGVASVVDVRRFPRSRRHPQFNQAALADRLAEAGITYCHEVDLGGRRTGEPGAERFGCLDDEGLRSYVAWMGTPQWQAALGRALGNERPCLMCAETAWWQCHRRFIADALFAGGVPVRHLGRRHEAEGHRLFAEAEAREGRLYLCGELVV
jgi:uncharacterized protein (DUF488 family)